jgi:hypothetical protein
MFERILKFISGMFREKDGTPSSSRVFLFVAAVFVGALLWRLFGYLMHLQDATILGVWLANLAIIIAALVGFILLPYGTNQASGAVTSGAQAVVNLVAALKAKQVQPTVPMPDGTQTDQTTGKID